MLPLMRNPLAAAPLCRFANRATSRLALSSLSYHAQSKSAHHTLSSSTTINTSGISTLPKSHSLSRQLSQTNQLHFRLYTTAHSSSNTDKSRTSHIASIAIAGLGTAFLLDHFLSQSPLQSESESTPEEPTVDPAKRKGFAPPVPEDDEDLHRRSIVVRFFIKTGNVIHAVIIEPFGTARRFLYLLILFLPVIIASPMLLVGARREKGQMRGRKVRKDEEGDRWGAVWWYSFLVKQMERAGPTFIKLAQWAGSRQDLFPDELCQRLGRLHSNGKPHTFRYTKRVIERVFGRPFDEIFEEFGHEPMGIGAVAQVYKATLKHNLLPPGYRRAKKEATKGEAKQKISKTLALSYEEEAAPPQIPTNSVAIKILHPRVEKTIARDIKIMRFFAKAINAIPGAEWLSFPEEVDVFAEMMFSQLDLRNEANNLSRFEDNFARRRSAVSFPRPLTEFSTKQVLIEEYEDALPLKHFLQMGGAKFDHRIANLGLDAFLNMLLIDNFTHADLHPGNIMIKFYKPSTESLLSDVFARILSKFDNDYAPGHKKAPATPDDQVDESIVQRLRPLRHDQEAWLDELDRLDAQGYQPEIVLLDAGLTVELTPLNRRNFLDLFSAVAQFDGALAGHLMVERCRTPDLVVDEDVFAMKMQDLVLSVKSKTFSLAKIKISDVLNKVLMAVRDHHVKMEADFVNTVISILLLEGIGRQLDPEMDLFKSALPILRHLGRELQHQQGGGMMKVPKKEEIRRMLPMLKVWLYMEARGILSAFTDAKVSTVDAFMRYGWHSE
ncbi:related to aminoglycoside acetyltransferase regulator from P. stuartii [Melanopsichium pennsylvanicum]|uniref:Related to aminoglycoside acetyltransferase regulator from P. stuartii n=2 Tax=Melanopsichium pennsylvanicum TaxID=63383 RepID=A0AAJ5C4V4_9BASI|nr:abc1-domain-containing protein [Melanopsichium pennsylvanicum 4]SNX84075.1 related to aminoglycoside acetyltransferase regulator from P. stuartii [Melanopsichium pennsylvanicum]